MKYKHLIYGVFVASGVSGLMYEVVWLRMLARITGVTLYATATVLGAFMAGLAIGSFLFGRFVDKRSDGLRVYSVLELLVGSTALVMPLIFTALVPLYQYIYQATGGDAFLTSVVRCATLFVALLIPTTMMGGTLPVLTSCLVKRDQVFGRHFSLLYGLNTTGAVLGVLLSGFVTIGSLGEWGTITLGLAINLFVAAVAYLLYRADRKTAPAAAAASHVSPAGPAARQYSDRVRAAILLVFALSGLTALAYEVIWTRQLILFLKTSVYAFSAMLAIFLTGIALGSMVMSRWLDRLARPIALLAVLELIVGLLSVISLYLFQPLDTLHPDLGMGLFRARVLMWVLPPVILVFPITFVFGAIFPVAVRCFTQDVGKAGASVGTAYGANTVGSIVGSLAAGFLLVPLIGSTHTVILLACLNVVLGLVLAVIEYGASAFRRLAYVPLVAVFILAAVGAYGRDPFMATIEQRVFTLPVASETPDNPDVTKTEIYYHKEGLEGTLTAFNRHGVRFLWVNGQGMTHLGTETKLMAHLPLMVTPNPKEFLVICFGMGTTTRSASLYSGLNVTAVELVPDEFNTFRYYHSDAEEVKARPNVHLVANDGRNTLLLSSKKYDVISIDPAPPIWSAGTVNLYSREFFQLCKSRLTPDGVLCLWFPENGAPGAICYDESLAVIRTFGDVFEHTTLWNGPHHWGFYLLGSMRDVPPEEFRSREVKALAEPFIQADLREFDTTCDTVEKLDALRWLDAAGARDLSAGAALITDNDPFTEFYFWRQVRKKFAAPAPTGP